MKRILSIILSLSFSIGCMIVSTISTAAYRGDKTENCAYALYELGLFKGTSVKADGTPVFSLEKRPTRAQAIIMLVRLLGKEKAAQDGTWNIPFNDVTDAAKPYIGYAYANGLTKGKSETYFGAAEFISANQYLTFLLRALGYESGVDFDVSAPWKLSNKIGLTFNDYSKNGLDFTRGTVAVLSVSALTTYIKSGENSLIGKLCDEGAIDSQQIKDSEAKYIVTLADGISISDGAGQELDTLLGRIGAVKLSTPTNLTSYRNYDGYAYVSWDNPDSLWMNVFVADNPNGPFTSGCETNGSTTKIEADKNTKYVKIRATKAIKTNGRYTYEWSDFTDPISLETDTTPDVNRSYTATYKGSAVYYPGSINNPLLYVDTAYHAALGYLKYPAMAYTNSSDIIMIFYADDANSDLCVSGYIYACNAFGVYQRESYHVIFRGGNLSNYYVLM